MQTKIVILHANTINILLMDLKLSIFLWNKVPYICKGKFCIAALLDIIKVLKKETTIKKKLTLDQFQLFEIQRSLSEGNTKLSQTSVGRKSLALVSRVRQRDRNSWTESD